MKLSIVFLAILGLAVAAPANEVHSRKARSVSDDLSDFVALVPVDEVLEIAIQYLAEDEEVQAVILYIQTDEFHGLVQTVEALPEYIALLNYIEAQGLAVYDVIDLLHSIMGLPAMERSKRSVNSRITGGVSGLIDDLLAVLPTDQLKALYYEKLGSSPDFAALVAAFQSDNFRTVVAAVQAEESYQHLRTRLSALGVDVDKIIGLVRTMLGMN